MIPVDSHRRVVALVLGLPAMLGCAPTASGIAPGMAYRLDASELPRLEEAALLGSQSAALEVTQHYTFWDYDVEKLSYWQLVAAENGKLEAQYHLALDLSESEDADDRLRACHWANAVAQAGRQDLRENALELVKHLETQAGGDGQCRHVQDEGLPSALPALKREALLGSPHAAFKVLQHYMSETPALDVLSSWQLLASENGSMQGQLILAQRLMNSPQPHDWLRACFWARAAAQSAKREDHVEAQTLLGAIDAKIEGRRRCSAFKPDDETPPRDGE